MTTTYLIELRLNQPDMLLFLEHARMFKASIIAIPQEQKSEVTTDPQPAIQQDTDPIYKPKRGLRVQRRSRAKRGSKVIDAILGRMEDGGPTHVSMLKTALEKAGMKASSLHGALALLQKNGTIQHGDGDGIYLLTAHEGLAAE